MSDKPTERQVQREQAAADLRQRLAEVQLDGPFEFPRGGGFDVFAALGGGGPRGRFAICLRCGAMVVLDDPEELESGMQVERGVRLHTLWHEEAAR